METYSTYEILERMHSGQKARCVYGPYKNRIMALQGVSFTWATYHFIKLNKKLLECKWQLLTQEFWLKDEGDAD